MGLRDRPDGVHRPTLQREEIDGHVGGAGKIKHREFSMASGEMRRICGSCMSRATACCPRCTTATSCSWIWPDAPPTPPGIFALHDGMGLVAKRLDHIPNTEPPRVRIIPDNPLYAPYEGTAEEVNIIGGIRWFAREI